MKNKLNTILIIFAICSLVFCCVMFGIYSNKVERLNTEIVAIMEQKDSVINERGNTIQMLSDSLQTFNISGEKN